MDALPHVLHVLATPAPESIPLEIARATAVSGQARVSIVALRNRRSDIESSDVVVTGPFRLFTLLRKLRPDVVHVHHSLSALIAAASARLLRIPLVVKTEHRDRKTYSPVQRLLNIATFTLCDVVVCNSEATQSSISTWERRFCRIRVRRVYNGVDVAQIDRSRGQPALFRERWPQRHIIGSVGRLIPEKDHATLLQAVALLDRRGVPVSCVIVGEGPLRRDLEALADELGISEITLFPGRLPRSEVYSAMHSFDLFAMPSRTEGFCNAVVEAMAARVPVVATDAGALPEVTAGTAQLVPVHAPVALADALQRCVDRSPALLAQVESARDRANQVLSLENAVAGNVAAYEHECRVGRRLAPRRSSRMPSLDGNRPNADRSSAPRVEGD